MVLPGALANYVNTPDAPIAAEPAIIFLIADLRFC
jgi:hypothetical protein